MQNDFFPSEKLTVIRDLLAEAKHIVILTHMSPDGDAMGSALGMQHYLSGLYSISECNERSVRVIVPNTYPDFLAWMPGAEQVLIYDEHTEDADRLIREADLIICTDFNEPKRIGLAGERMLENACKKIVIDHHILCRSDADWHAQTVLLSYPESPSASELVYRLIRSLGGTLDLSAATAIYTGMMTDTGNFSFNSNHPEMYEILADLVRVGVDKDAVYNAVFNAHTADRMRLVGYCLYRKMRILPERHAALICLSRKELYRFRFQKGDAEGIVNMPLQIKDVYYSCFMREDKIEPHERERAGEAKTKVKISFRSQGDRPVNGFAHDWFAGGGHANAAGGEFFGSVDEAAACFMSHYLDYFNEE
ncbi:MAG: DHH family phosphoesterase [Paludibacteraceae bacterium]|nr:DHH family phosphoesterase [Paludibacteraceae bacterium]